LLGRVLVEEQFPMATTGKRRSGSMAMICAWSTMVASEARLNQFRIDLGWLGSKGRLKRFISLDVQFR